MGRFVAKHPSGVSYPEGITRSASDLNRKMLSREVMIADNEVRNPSESHAMNEEDLERYESEVELQIYKEYRDVLGMFRYVVETERRFYLANRVNLSKHQEDGSVHFEVELEDAWVWDMYRPARFLQRVRVLTFRDVNIEELEPGVRL